MTTSSGWAESSSSIDPKAGEPVLVRHHARRSSDGSAPPTTSTSATARSAGMELSGCPPEADDCSSHRESLAASCARGRVVAAGNGRVPGEQRLAVDEQAGVARRVAGKRTISRRPSPATSWEAGNAPVGGPSKSTSVGVSRPASGGAGSRADGL